MRVLQYNPMASICEQGKDQGWVAFEGHIPRVSFTTALGMPGRTTNIFITKTQSLKEQKREILVNATKNNIIKNPTLLSQVYRFKSGSHVYTGISTMNHLSTIVVNEIGDWDKCNNPMI